MNETYDVHLKSQVEMNVAMKRPTHVGMNRMAFQIQAYLSHSIFAHKRERAVRDTQYTVLKFNKQHVTNWETK